MRAFTFYTTDKLYSFSLNTSRALAADPTGLGNAFATSYKDSTARKYLTNSKPDFEPVKMRIYFNGDGSSGYANYKTFAQFLQRVGRSPFILEYNDGILKKFCDIVLKTLPKSELKDDGFAEDFTFDRLSYWYEEVASTFALISADAANTAFPILFPFGFKGKIFVNEFEVQNNFFEEAPIIITISGAIANDIKVFIRDKNTDALVGEIDIAQNSASGTTLIINADTKKITYFNGSETVNAYGLTDKTKQSFLYLPQGVYKISSSLLATDAGEISIAIKRYLFD